MIKTYTKEEKLRLLQYWSIFQGGGATEEKAPITIATPTGITVTEL